MNWEKKNIPQESIRDIAAKYECDLLTASVLARRGLTGGEQLRYFLEDDPRYLRNPFDIPGMEDAVDRILAAKDEGEKILVFGDRDVDGITSTALLTSFLKKNGMDVSWQLPVGEEAYGLSVKAVEEFAAAAGSLIITVDCGVSNRAEVSLAAELGVDVIITDHHNPPEELPQALSIVNPKLKGSRYAFRDLAGCGVTYKLVSALRFALKSELYGQSICLLNVRPATDAYIIELAKMRNLAVIDAITETVVPGMVRIGETRIPSFLEGQHILSWDVPLQQKILARLFGNNFEMYMQDLAQEIPKWIPSTSGKSLLKIKEFSRIARYAGANYSELDVLVNLFTSFVQNREKLYDGDSGNEFQLAALGTMADLMPLRDENRIIVRNGISSLVEKPMPGISALLFKLDLAGRRIGTSEISWQLNPVLNAAGRMGDAEKALNLLLSEDVNERERLANEIIAMNEDRKKKGSDTWTIVEPLAEKGLAGYEGKLAVAFGENIFRGVTGLMAGRLVSRFKVPALVAAFNDKIATGSLRSVKGYDLRFLMEPCADLFIDWGGHNYAAGFSMHRSNWETFLQRLRDASRSMEIAPDTEETVSVDAELPSSYMTTDIFKLVDRFEPYGEENSPLTFMSRGLKVLDIGFMGKTGARHVKLTLDAGKHKWPAVYWQAADRVKRDFDINDTIDLVYQFSRNFFNGMETPQLVVTDLRRSSPETNGGL